MATATRYRMKGVDLSANRVGQVEVERELDMVQHALSNESKNATDQLRPAPAAMPILVDDSGEEFVVMHTDQGPTTVPWISGSDVDVEENIQAGGFISTEGMQDLKKKSPALPPDQPTRKQLIAAVLAALKEQGILPPDNPKKAGSSLSRKNGTQTSTTDTQPSDNPAMTTEERLRAVQESLIALGNQGSDPDLEDALKDHIPTVIKEQLAQMLTDGLADGFNGDLLRLDLKGALSSFAGAAAAYGMQQWMDLDDESSTEEWAALMVGPQLAKLGFSMLGAKYWGAKGPYASPALRVCDTDLATNNICCGMPSVVIEGMPAAREGDAVAKAGIVCKYGAATVKIGGCSAARVDEPGGYGTESMVAPFKKGASRTFIGGPTSNPAPPPPTELVGAIAELGAMCGERNTDGPPPESPMLWFDEKEGEWRIYDPEMGDSSTYQQVFDNAFFWGTDDLFDTDNWDPSKVRDNWYEMNGFLEFGSPQWPGAGNAGTWLVPDTFFGLDMSPYFTFHDWKFDPRNHDWATLFGVEFQSWLQGIINAPLLLIPFHVIVQTGYSLATILHGISERWDENRNPTRKK